MPKAVREALGLKEGDQVVFRVDTNVLIRHLTGDPPEQARRATAFLAGADDLRLADVVVAETVYVLESRYGVAREDVVAFLEAILAFRALRVTDHERLHFAEAYLVAVAEVSGIRSIASFDRGIDRVGWIQRVGPG